MRGDTHGGIVAHSMSATVLLLAALISHEPGITRELVAATNRIVKTGSPVY
jgi:hypothetical protein